MHAMDSQRARPSDDLPDDARAPLWPNHTADGEAAGQPPVGTRGRRGSKTRFGWVVWLSLCCISLLLLSGLVFSRMTTSQTDLQSAPSSESGSVMPSAGGEDNDHDHEEGHDGEEHDDHDEGEAHHDDDHGDDHHEDQQGGPKTLAEQLDLATGFVISDKPATREYVFNLTRGSYAPDGFDKSMILVNGQSPGPLIEANSGDLIRITVHNMMPEDETSIHWHGIDQRNTNWMDGVHGITQCAIPPGESFTYEFNVTGQRGTFWYHAHVSVQLADGLYGPLVIHDPLEQVPHVDDDKIVMMGDLFYTDSKKLVAEYLSSSPSWSKMSGMEPPPNNVILNGKHVSNCTHKAEHGETSEATDVNRISPTDCAGGSIYTTHVHSNQETRFRLISHSTSYAFWFTIDNHTMEIVEIDGVEVEPIPTTRIFLNPGQRYSVIISTNQKPGNYRIRASAATYCFHMPHDGIDQLEDINFEATGILSYDDTDVKAEPIGTPWNLNIRKTDNIKHEPWKSACGDIPFDVPKPKRGMDAFDVGDRNYHYFNFDRNREDGLMRSTINGTTYTPLTDDAVLWKVPEQNLTAGNLDSDKPGWDFGANQLVLVSRDADKGAQIVINAKAMMMHPFHLHGQTFQVVGWGQGTYSPKKTTWNLENPMRRDTITLNGFDYVVLRIKADNPGIWALHCHISWHAEEGMFVSIGQRLDEMTKMLDSLEKSDSAAHDVRRKFCQSKK